MYLAYNKAINKPAIEAKAVLMDETLSTLKTEKIKDFFKHVRATEDTMPNDGQLKKILSANYQKFSNSKPEKQIEYKGEHPDKEWRTRFWAGARQVLAGKTTVEEVKQEMGL